MNEHTPGPWSITSKPDDEYPVFDIGHQLSNGPFKGDVMIVCDTVEEANAHLIAAAPEMYEALKAIEAEAHVNSTNYDLVIAAIAKAEGRR